MGNTHNVRASGISYVLLSARLVPGHLLQYSSFRSIPNAVCNMQAKAHRLIGMLAVSDRHVTEDGTVTFSEQKVLMTLIDCASVEAAKELAEKAPASHKP